MARGKKIILSPDPKGTRDEGIISGTPKPGTLMQMKANTPLVAGRPTWEPLAPGTDGLPRGICVLLEDTYQGKTTEDAYVSGTRGFLYWPHAGEELNIRIGEVAGTGNSVTQGDLFIADAEDGILVPNAGSPGSIPFQAMETMAQFAGSTLVWCKFLGS